MAYRLVDSITGTTESFGCLAGVRAKLSQHGSIKRKSLTANMYSHDNFGYAYPYESLSYFHNMSDGPRKEERKEYIVAAIRESAAALPVGIFGSEEARDHAVETGHITIHHADTAAEVHARLAPFRIFIERGECIEFFNKAKQYGTLAAWVASHFYVVRRVSACTKGIQFLRAEGWHQSMFPEIDPTDELMDPSSIRRIVALYPEYRHFIKSTGTGVIGDEYVTLPAVIGNTYTIPDLDYDIGNQLCEAVSKALPRIPDVNKDMEATVAYYQLWIDTILHTCKELS